MNIEQVKYIFTWYFRLYKELSRVEIITFKHKINLNYI